MTPEGGSVTLPSWINYVAFYSSIIATIIIFTSIIQHLRNYRKPVEQHFMIRIQLIVPLFALSCYSMLVNQSAPLNKYMLEPIREVYEAFVIYTFFSLLTDMLGGERNIIIMTLGRQPVPHPGFLGYILPRLDISDPHTFLGIKRGILQYVWLKPFICFSTLFFEAMNMYNVNDMGLKSIYLWLTIIYNFSVTLSLYCLAIFWKILWDDLKPFKPVGKFLCVKLIIFALYWQGVILALLNFFQILPQAEEGKVGLVGLCIQNALLCVELIFFAIGHYVSFSYYPYTLSQMPSGRLRFIYAVRDTFGIKDLVYDFKLTFYGDFYKDYKQFDSVEALIAHPESNGRMGRISQGLRYHVNGKHKHWLPNLQSHQNRQVRSTLEIQATIPVDANTADSSIRNEVRYPDSSLITHDDMSLASTGTSTRAIYPRSPPGSGCSSPSLLAEEPSILATLKQDPYLAQIDYDNEMFDEDEEYYQQACDVINNYKLDQVEIKRLLNYPIVDELISGHVFGYKVQQLRKNRVKNYGSIV